MHPYRRLIETCSIRAGKPFKEVTASLTGRRRSEAGIGFWWRLMHMDSSLLPGMVLLLILRERLMMLMENGGETIGKILISVTSNQY